jgi:pyruvate/2-oxoacid:ferredoxin oxidoreductase beta subunit
MEYQTEVQMKVVDAMQDYGGSFVKALAECYRRADPINFAKLQNAFPEYWEQYDGMAKHHEWRNGKNI